MAVPLLQRQPPLRRRQSQPSPRHRPPPRPPLHQPLQRPPPLRLRPRRLPRLPPPRYRFRPLRATRAYGPKARIRRHSLNGWHQLHRRWRPGQGLREDGRAGRTPRSQADLSRTPQLIQSKQIQFANIAQGSAYDAWNGTGWAKSKHTDIRSLFGVLPQWQHGWALAKSGIKSYRDLNGKTASGGPAGGTSDLYLKQFTELLGIKLSKVSAASYADTTGLLKDGLVDAVSTSAGVPHPSAAEIASTQDTVVFGFTPDDVKKIVEKYPSQAAGQIAANTYKGQTQPVDSVADWVAFFCHKDMPEDFVYEFVKAVFENKEMLVSVHKAMADTTEANVKTVTLPMHPGAYRYFVEKGIPMSPLAKPVQ